MQLRPLVATRPGVVLSCALALFFASGALGARAEAPAERASRAALEERALHLYDATGLYLDEVAAELEAMDEDDRGPVLVEAEQLAELHAILGEELGRLEYVSPEEWPAYERELRLLLGRVERQVARVRALLGPTAA